MINLYHVQPGSRLRLNDGRTGVVVENIGDGQWLEVRFAGGEEEPELVHSQDVVALLEGED